MNKKITILSAVFSVIIISLIVVMLSRSNAPQDSDKSAEGCTNCETTTITTIPSTTPTTIMSITTTTKPTVWAAITKLFKGPTGGSKASEGSKDTGPTIISRDHKLEIYLIGDLSSNDEYTSISIEAENIGDACVDTCHQCEPAYELGLTHTITAEDFSNYCLDDTIEITFSDNWSVNCCCNSKHKACIDGSCCEAVCTGRACTNSVYFNCDDLSCKTPS